MLLTPEEINSIQFATTRLKEGYDQNEVDSFLDRVVADYTALHTELAKSEAARESLKRRNESLTNQPTAVIQPVKPAGAPSPSAEGILRLAQETADRHVAEAQAKGDEIVRDAGAQAARIVEEADEAADNIRLDARKRANDIIAVAQAEANEVASQKNKLAAQVDKLAETREKYKALLQAALNRMEEEEADG